ncbi:TniQ family protein, partial [Cupriavidus cauae]
MAGYPSVNWWPHNLRPYESALSFVARFCALNGVPARAGTAFLGVEPRHPRFVSDDDVARVSSLLGEDPARLTDVLQHALDFRQCGTYAPPPAYSQGPSVRYCAACAQQGYHSYLHEVPWLTKCPVHLTALTTVPANRSGNIGERRLGAFKRLMQGHCAAWPHFAPDGFPTREPGALLTLAAWVRDACDASKRMQAGELWRSEAGTH